MVTTSALRRWAVLPVFLVAVALVAVTGSLAASGSGAEYLALERPAWAPPQWLFGPVWTALYVLIAVAGWLAWTARGWSSALTAYAVQLVLNTAWTPLFFAAGQYGLAFAEICLLWIAIVATMALMWPIKRPAALLMAPYLVWVTYAGALNLAVWQLN
ncbi:TspO/MBR family protein [Planomonospora venezuelensis]|uniref:Tryptophan-rich sensory protein n=1 Tax=Planomonospora venezuelensis TaxID=1999 RepID=A0A841DH34_PLAVE|nr:TspO/MBR family protein [Planomonospora venezuelensis]MBB5967694.1 tryptophan-rich sensory protein [Planomonospora venezuelensis]GIN01056.1 putative TspO/MBR-related protein precursor [Planomonospora venezuelensis]